MSPYFMSHESYIMSHLADDFKGKPPHWLLGVNSYWKKMEKTGGKMEKRKVLRTA